MKTHSAISISLVMAMALDILPATAVAKTVGTSSPDGNISVSLDDSNGKDILLSVSHSGKALIENSPIALNIRDGKPATKIKSSKEFKNHTETVDAPNHHTPTKTDGSRTFPWRVFAITTDDTQMPTNNLVYALASPSKVSDISWVKPGKSAWEWWNDWGLRNVPFQAGINNDTYKYFIDFAADNGIEYVILDEGWYNPKSGDMLTTIPEIDLPMLISYANEKGVGMWLWTVFNVLDFENQQSDNRKPTTKYPT